MELVRGSRFPRQGFPLPEWSFFWRTKSACFSRRYSMYSRFMRRTASMSSSSVPSRVLPSVRIKLAAEMMRSQKLSAGSVPMEPREARASLGSRPNVGSSAIFLYKHETSSGSKSSTRSNPAKPGNSVFHLIFLECFSQAFQAFWNSFLSSSSRLEHGVAAAAAPPASSSSSSSTSISQAPRPRPASSSSSSSSSCWSSTIPDAATFSCL
mmetsp:Transcript_17226/g.55922  ORF Transcript_17226/g.55922 Transcript_17226/m.55922 type:complete len:210 (+) Transcript_17226:403-1032(+)